MRLVMAIVIALLTVGQVSNATTIVKLSFDDVVRAADGVLAGTVADIVSRKGQDGIIYTFVTLDALETIRGNYDGERFTLRLEGGEVEGEVLRVEGAPRFREGERIVVFVEGNGERIVPIAGWEQGLFRVVRDPATGQEYISDALGNRVFGIRQGEVIKEGRVGTEAELFGQGPGFAAAQSEAPAIDFGRTNGGREVFPEEEARGQAPTLETQAIVGDVLTYSAFKQRIEAQMDAAGVGEMRTMVSVEPGSPPARPFEDAEPARIPTEPVELAPSERGDAPRRIDEGTRTNPDQQ